MATIKYLLQSESANVPIYLRLSLAKNKSYKRKTGIFINPRNWSKATGFPKQNDVKNKNTSARLKELEAFIYDNINTSESSLKSIDGIWLEQKINQFHGYKEEGSKEFLTEYCNFFLSKMRNSQKSVATVKKYYTIIKKLNAYQQSINKKLLVEEVDLSFREKFIDYLSVQNKLSMNTIGRYLKFVKTICLDADKNGVPVSKQLAFFKGFTEESPTVTLSFNDLQKIKNAELNEDKYEISRDWLIIGCYTGQRVSDLLRMSLKMIQNIQHYDFIVLNQKKTGKIVQIPIHPEVRTILDKRKGQFPPLFTNNIESNKTFFNRYLKDLCEKASINELVEGNLYDEETKRTRKGLYEKYKLVSSHICRRSFATNFYGNSKYPTPILMNITAHSTERQFLEYIGKKPIDYSLQLAKIWNENE
ncbi:phage integrase SAM-like domain-containing protein [Maribacter litoralis]|uniref:phage integrase SAM-like domain-containing protein n=1 Tax=Maribacter litoralis TaxID=2059726 RepID=UPI003D2C44DA